MVDLSMPALLIDQSQNEKISLGALSDSARGLISKIAADQDLMLDLFVYFRREGKLDWNCLEKMAGPLSFSDKRLLELIALLFIPDDSLEFVVSGNWHVPDFIR